MAESAFYNPILNPDWDHYGTFLGQGDLTGTTDFAGEAVITQKGEAIALAVNVDTVLDAEVTLTLVRNGSAVATAVVRPAAALAADTARLYELDTPVVLDGGDKIGLNSSGETSTSVGHFGLLQRKKIK